MSIGITHSELDFLTLAELNERIVGFVARENRSWQRAAKLTASILACLSGTAVKPRDVLPEVFPELPSLTKEEKQKELDDIKREVGLLN